MTQDNSDTIIRAYATLSALRKNIDKVPTVSIPETFVQEYHNVLDKLQEIEIRVDEFRIPDANVKPKVTSSSYADGSSRQRYSEIKYVDKYFILSKLDAILGYFEFTMSEKPKSLGFRKPGE